jgi:phosphoribosyl-ATP pyrophosphohydrolase
VTLEELEGIVDSRRSASPEQSYTATLLADGELIQRKIIEEAFEVCLELNRPEPDAERVASEAADVVYHLLVGLASVDVKVADVLAALESRRR